MGIFDKVNNFFAKKSAVNFISQNPILRVAIEVSAKTLEQTELNKFSDKTKENLSNQLFKEINEIISASNKIYACREKLVSYTIIFSEAQVLMLDKNSEEDPTKLIGTQGISGEMRDKIFDLSKVNEELIQLMSEFDDYNLKDIKDVITIKYHKAYWMMTVFDAIRKHLNDFSPEKDKDWHKYLIHAQCVTAEDRYRKELKMKSLFPDDYVTPLAYMVFFNFVVSDSKFPVLDWKEEYKDLIEEGSLKPPY